MNAADRQFRIPHPPRWARTKSPPPPDDALRPPAETPALTPSPAPHQRPEASQEGRKSAPLDLRHADLATILAVHRLLREHKELPSVELKERRGLMDCEARARFALQESARRSFFVACRSTELRKSRAKVRMRRIARSHVAAPFDKPRDSDAAASAADWSKRDSTSSDGLTRLELLRSGSELRRHLPTVAFRPPQPPAAPPAVVAARNRGPPSPPPAEPAPADEVVAPVVVLAPSDAAADGEQHVAEVDEATAVPEGDSPARSEDATGRAAESFCEPQGVQPLEADEIGSDEGDDYGDETFESDTGASPPRQLPPSEGAECIATTPEHQEEEADAAAVAEPHEISDAPTAPENAGVNADAGNAENGSPDVAAQEVTSVDVTQPSPRSTSSSSSRRSSSSSSPSSSSPRSEDDESSFARNRETSERASSRSRTPQSDRSRSATPQSPEASQSQQQGAAAASSDSESEGDEDDGWQPLALAAATPTPS